MPKSKAFVVLGELTDLQVSVAPQSPEDEVLATAKAEMRALCTPVERAILSLPPSWPTNPSKMDVWRTYAWSRVLWGLHSLPELAATPHLDRLIDQCITSSLAAWGMKVIQVGPDRCRAEFLHRGQIHKVEIAGAQPVAEIRAALPLVEFMHLPPLVDGLYSWSLEFAIGLALALETPEYGARRLNMHKEFRDMLAEVRAAADTPPAPPEVPLTDEELQGILAARWGCEIAVIESNLNNEKFWVVTLPYYVDGKFNTIGMGSTPRAALEAAKEIVPPWEAEPGARRSGVVVLKHEP